MTPAAALLSTSLFAAAPALAQQQIETDQSNVLIIPGIPSLSGIDLVLTGQTFNQTNGVANSIVNASPVSAEKFTQSAKVSQTNSITIEADNAVPLSSATTGINAQIDGNTFNQTNGAATTISNSGNIFADTFRQLVSLSQANSLAVEIANRSSIAAGTVGINAEIDNNVFNQTNGAATTITNSGNVFADAFRQSVQLSQINDIGIHIDNSGSITAGDTGIKAQITGNEFNQTNGAATTINNSGDISADKFAQSVQINQTNSIAIEISNSGSIKAGNIGIDAVFNNNTFTQTNGAATTITNTGIVPPKFTQSISVDQANAASLGVQITNSGSVFGGNIGINTNSDAGTFILNSGSISAGSGLAIKTSGLGSIITNASGGLITGFVELTDNTDQFFNQSGSIFQARLTSDFGSGTDLFANAGIVQTAADAHVAEITTFINLEEFDNSGVISLVDGKEGDLFLLDPLLYQASTGSTLAVDTRLAGPGSTSDILQIEGEVKGKTAIDVHNTTPGGGALGAVIPVVLVNGSVDSNAFYLKNGPVDSGLFDYNLFFAPGVTDIFELRSGIGGGAFVLPQLTTGLQDIWHTTSDSWFDRTADLRTALYGGGSPARPPRLGPSGGAYIAPPSYVAPGAEYAGTGIGVPYPGLWARGSFASLSRDDSANTAFSRVNLNRDQNVEEFEGGIDFGKRNLLHPGDALIFGVLGGFVSSDLDYDQIARSFNIQGAQVGAYATYLNGGLFIDTLVKDDILTIDSDVAYGTPASLSANNIGVRTDAGYRFGALAGGGYFFEPLATVAWVNSQIDDFARGANRVNFDDGNSVRGRLGMRLGRSMQMGKFIFEPFVIGSVWHEFEDQNNALLTTTGAITFNLADSLNGTWGEVSAGANLFDVSANASGFAKVDVAFGDSFDSVAGRVGMRLKW